LVIALLKWLSANANQSKESFKASTIAGNPNIKNNELNKSLKHL